MAAAQRREQAREERLERGRREREASIRKRKNQLSDLPHFCEGDELDEYLYTLEEQLRLCEIREDEWAVEV